MKNSFAYMCKLCLLTACGFCVENSDQEGNLERLKMDPGVYLNSQDVPIFFQNNPLEGLNAFAVLPPYAIQDAEVIKIIESVIEKELSSIGTVIKSKCTEMTGFGTGNILKIQTGSVSKWDGGELPITKVTLDVESPVIMKKTQVKCFPMIWTINDFVDSSFEIQSEDRVVGAVHKLLKEFVKNYKFANSKQPQKPIFYIYTIHPESTQES